MKNVLLFLSLFSLFVSQAQTVVKKDGYFGLMDSEMHFLLDPVFTEFRPIAPNTYYEDKAYFGRKGNEKWLYFIDDSVFIAEQIDTFKLERVHNYIRFEINAKFGAICIGKNQTAPKYVSYWFESTRLIEPEYESLWFYEDYNPYAHVRKNGKYGVLDANLNRLLVPCQFENRLSPRSFKTNHDFFFAEAQDKNDLDSLFIPLCQKVFSFPHYSNFIGTQDTELLLYFNNYLSNKEGILQLINIKTGEIVLSFSYFSSGKTEYSRTDVGYLNERILTYNITGKDEKGKRFHRILFIDVMNAKMLYEITSDKFEDVYLSGTGIYLSNYPNQLLKKNKIGEISENGTVLWLSK